MNGNEDSTAACPQASLLGIANDIYAIKNAAQLVVMAASDIEDREQMNALAWLGYTIWLKLSRLQGMVDKIRATASGDEGAATDEVAS